MKKKFIRDLEDGMRIEEMFAVKEKSREITKNKKVYIVLKLSDKTGVISGKIWDDAEKKYNTFDKGDIVLVEGYTRVYKGILELTINKIKKCEEGEYELEDFIPTSGRNIEEMHRELEALIKSVHNEYLNALLTAIFGDKEFSKKFDIAPGSAGIHHTYVGGLLEHTLNVAKICDTVASTYPEIDRDLLITGALLHDIGKIEEYEVSASISSTNAGKLIGHIVIGTYIIKKNIEKIEEFPPELSMSLIHLIVSHHGEYEFGSPKLPQTAEAAALAYADLLDSKTESFLEVKKNTKEEWSKYVGYLERKIYVGKKDTDKGNS